MKIAIDAVGIRGHGGAAVLCELLLWLPVVRPDWEWHVFIFNRSLREFDDPSVSDKVTFEHTDFGNNGISRLLWVNYILPKRLQEIKADVLFSFANMAPSRPRIPQVVFCHQASAFSAEVLEDSSLFKRLRLLCMREQIMRGARASRTIIVQTEALRKRIEEKDPALEGRIHIIPSGCRTSSRTPSIHPAKKALIDNASRPRLIYVSHPGSSKNHLAVVRAMPLIIKRFPSASILLTLEEMRTPPSPYNVFVDKIHCEAEVRGVLNKICWLGILKPDEVDYALQSSDLMVFPSLSESMGLGLVEAMAAGCPVVASDMPYAHDVCGEAAVYFDPHSPERLAETVNRVIEDAELRALMLQHCGIRKDRFTYVNIAAAIVEELAKAVRI